jgi:hypothetical protein
MLYFLVIFLDTKGLTETAWVKLLEASVNNSDPHFLDRGSGKWSSMDSHVYQGKPSEMTSTDSLTLGSEENQQTNCQLAAAYGRDAIRHLEYKNPKDVGLTTRRQSQPSTPKARVVRKVPKRFRHGERLADGRMCGKTYTNRYGISKHIKVVHRTESSPAKPSVESEAVDVQIPE